MFESIKSRIKNFIDSSNPFSSYSIVPFSKYKKNYSKADYLSAYEISLYVNRALNKRAEKVGEIKFQLKNGDKVISNHPVLDVLSKPNKSFTGSQFWALYQKYMDIFGEAYILTDSELQIGGKRKISELHLLRSDCVKPYFNEKTGELIKVEYRTANGEITVEGDKIIYVHNPDPASPLRGESLLRAGIRSIETSTQIDEYHSKILENGGRVEGVFNFKATNITKTQLSEMKEKFQEEYGNASRAGMPMFLAGDASYEKLAISPNELGYLETKKTTFDDITVLTGVPKALLGLTSDSTFANSDAAIRIFLREVIWPIKKSLAENLDLSIIEESLDLVCVDDTPENKEDKRNDLETADKVHALTLNEKRELLGLDPVKYGDVIYAPFNLAPLGKTEEAKTQKKKSVAQVNHILRDKGNRLMYHALQLKRLDKRQLKMQDAIQEYFNGQRDRVISNLSERKQFRKKDILGEIFVNSLEIGLAKETVLPILAQLLREAGEDSKEISGSDWEFHETAEIASWLDKKTEVFAERINKTTFEKLKDTFQESLNNAESRQQLIKRIENVYGDINKSRAAVIARTEVHGVTQYGTMEGYRQAGMQVKIWVWAPGTKGGVRDDHRAMDGEEKPINTAFSNGLMFPGSNGPAYEVINCECFI